MNIPFFKKKEPDKVDLTLLERVEKLESKLRVLDSNVIDINMSYDILRNKVLRKIQHKKEIEKEEETTSEGKLLVE